MSRQITLGELLEWLEKQDQDQKVRYGFGEPHTDRGCYNDLAFEPVHETTIREMLGWAESCLGVAFEGYKGGEYVMDNSSFVLIGMWGSCGKPILNLHLDFWEAQFRDWDAPVLVNDHESVVAFGRELSAFEVLGLAREALREQAKSTAYYNGHTLRGDEPAINRNRRQHKIEYRWQEYLHASVLYLALGNNKGELT